GLTQTLEARGIGRGQRVVLLSPNSIEMDVAHLAVMAAGAQVAPANPFFTVPELTKLLRDIEPSLVICDTRVAEKAAAVAAALNISGGCLALGQDAAAAAAHGLQCLSVDEWTGRAELKLDPSTFPTADDLALIIFT